MEILNISVMRGPNYWSVYRKKIIVMKLDIGELEQFPSNAIEGFGQSLFTILPSLITHRCSEGEEGGFLKRINEGTWMGHIVEHIALELQSLAGMECGYGRTRSTDVSGVYHVVFSYLNEKAGIYAAKAAVNLVEHIIYKKDFNIEEVINDLQNIYNREKLGPSTLSIIDEAEKRKIPYLRLNNRSLLMFGQGCNKKVVCATIASTTSSLAVELACNKDATRNLLSQARVPVPVGTLMRNINNLEEVIQEIGFPVVTKPVNGNHGRGITTRIFTMEQAIKGFQEAQKISEYVIVERFIYGTDYRFLVINFKLIAVAKRTPAMVMGDGTSTIAELIEETNNDLRRGEGHEKTLTIIKIDASTEAILEENNFTTNSILPLGEILFLKNTANMSSGGTATDVTDLVHPQNVFLAERIARLMNLDICGIDIMAEDINKPITDKNGAVLEVNAAPGFRMHLDPSKGFSRNVAEPVMDMLFPGNSNGRIPLVAVTGTNGKTTVTRLIAHIAQTAGHHTGFTTTDGIYIDGKNIFYGDCSGPNSAQTVLADPIVDFAVFECARGGILRAGLGFDNCNISVVTNITDDHLGLNDIHSIQDLAKVKIVVPQSTFDDGYAILNADDDLVYAMKRKLDCNVALFSLDGNNPRIKNHCANGGMAIFIENNYFVLSKGEWKSRIIAVTDVPLTFSGKCEFMIKNILPAILASVISNFSTSIIVDALKSFIPSAYLTPGRMNLFEFNNFKLMVDYMHNNDGYAQMKKYLDQISANKKVGIIAATGDRREFDIKNLGRYSAQMFDEIIIRHDRNNRGRTKAELNELILSGIREINPDIPVFIISDELNALQYAMDNAKTGDFIFHIADNIQNTLEFLKKQLENDKGALSLLPQNS